MSAVQWTAVIVTLVSMVIAYWAAADTVRSARRAQAALLRTQKALDEIKEVHDRVERLR